MVESREVGAQMGDRIGARKKCSSTESACNVVFSISYCLTPTYLPQNEEEGCLALLIITLTGSYYIIRSLF